MVDVPGQNKNAQSYFVALGIDSVLDEISAHKNHPFDMLCANYIKWMGLYPSQRRLNFNYFGSFGEINV